MAAMADKPALVRLVSVAKEYPAAEGLNPISILQDISLDVLPGESLAIVGPSGSGKSTLLNLLGTLDRPTRGDVIFNGRPTSGFDDNALADLRNREIGFIFQSHHLLPQCSVLENVLVPTLPRRDRDRHADETRGRKLLERVGLGSRLTHRPGQLSGGERQRVAVVRALINQPRLLLADEPTGALDRASAEALIQLLATLNREEGITLVVVTHALDLAHQLRKVLELRDGKLAEHLSA